MPNTIPLKTVYERSFQDTHYKKAVFPLFADTRFQTILKDGATVQWDYDDDATADSLDGSDGYTLENKTVTAETLTVNQKPSHGFKIGGTQAIQDHHPTQQKWATKAMNVIFNKIDGDILNDLRTNAASTLDASSFGGNVGDPIVATSSNAAAIFAACQRILTNQSVIYDENKQFQNDVQLDGGDRMPIAAIPAELKEQLLLQVGFKNTDYADTVMKSGYMGPMFGFNAIASTALPFTCRLTFTAQPTDATILTIGGVVFTWETGTVDVAGEVKSETSAAASVAHLVAVLNDPYGASAGAYQGFTRASITKAQRRILDNISATDNLDGSCVIAIRGQGTVAVSQTDTAGTLDRKAVHAIFGVSRTIGVVMQRTPGIEVSAGNLITTGELSGYVGKQYLAWALYGRKVFQTQKQGLIDVPIAADTFASPASVIN